MTTDFDFIAFQRGVWIVGLSKCMSLSMRTHFFMLVYILIPLRLLSLPSCTKNM